MTTPARSRYAGHRFPLSLRMVEEMLAARGIPVSHDTVRRWGLKFGQAFANQIRRRLPGAGDKWHLDEVVIRIAGATHWLWRAVDQHGRPRARRAGAEPARQAGGQAPAAPAAEEADAAAADLLR